LPSLGGGKLTISTSGSGTQNVYYIQHGAQLVVPDPLVIEFRARFVSGTSSEASRTGMGVQFQRDPYVVNNLFIQDGEIFVLAGNLTKGASASVPTMDAMHTYRIVLSGSSIEVSYDGAVKLTGQTFFDPAAQPDASIIWGEASGAAIGTSEWESFEHNAGGCMPTPTRRYSWGKLRVLYR
jgi:hypothetical protein